MLVAIKSGPLPATGIIQMNNFQLVKPDILVETCKSLIHAFLSVKIHPCSVGVASIETDAQSFPLFHSVYDLSNVGKVRAHAVPLPRHVFQENPGIFLDAFYSHIQGVGESL